MNPESQALWVFWNHKRFWIFQTLAIAVWIALVLAWFWLPDSRLWGITLSALQGIVVVVGGLWLIGSALVFYRRAHAGDDPRLGEIGRESLRKIPALFGWALVLALAIWISAGTKVAAWIWTVPALLLLPVAAQVTGEGGFRMPWRARYFPLAILLLAVGTYLPYKLIAWHPQPSGFAMQTASLSLRLFVAYMVAVTAWLILASLLANSGRKAVDR